MWDIKPRRVLVPVENAECQAALEYAAREARERRVGVHLVHVVPVVMGGANAVNTLAIVNGELHDLGRKVLGDTANALEHMLADDDLTVTTELYHGPVVPTIVDESAHACLVVLQHRGMGHGHTPVLSVTNGVAARSHAPVVAIPAGWHAAATASAPVVTVGVGDDPEVGHLVEVAAEAANRLGARLRILHAGDDLDPAELVGVVPVAQVEYAVSTYEPADALLDLADETTLFVVGRRHPRLPLGQHLGPVVRTLLRRSPVPVMVVDPGRDDSEDRRDLATASHH